MDILKEQLKVNIFVGEAEKELKLMSLIELPYYLPPIGKIIRAYAESKIQKAMVENGKVRINGVVTVHIYYSAQNRHDEVFHYEKNLPFEDLLDLPGVSKGDLVKGTSEVINFKANITDEGEKLSVEVTLKNKVRAVKTTVLEVITDVPDNLLPEKTLIKVDAVIGMGEKEKSYQSRVKIPKDKPDIDGVLNITGEFRAKSARALAGKVVVEGEIEAKVTYHHEDPEYTVRFTIPVFEFIEVPLAEEGMMGEVNGEILEIKAGKIGNRELRIEAKLKLLAQALMEKQLRVVTRLTGAEYTTKKLIAERVVGENTAQTTAQREWKLDGEVKILHIHQEKAVVKTSRLTDGESEIQGEAMLGVMYLPEGSEEIRHLDINVPFKLTVSIPGAKPGQNLYTWPKVEYANVKVIEHCTLQAEVVVRVRAKVTETVSQDVVTEVGEVAGMPPETMEYVIKPGDTFYKIAKKIGVPVEEIIKLNPGKDPQKLMPGDVILLPVSPGPPLG
ncbi:DUF3794 and LysM peptidoglycan-binding domain-containing protein [Carboxydothermus ferrireducens]|uniref:LysM repeat protein n=1 Tax=Carboxydothermus ferrireducens DSM 11255 TaxID=1119529 RepID=A0ABX2R907_9THEO|nr:SPOCS domain-containing protein [Carboxydothermus ferrireducens]NYE57664.1 LysM repeat protein [Carboxydothermus ferrireducens DSM 11255]